MAVITTRHAIFMLSFLFGYILVQGQETVSELPHCIENNDPGCGRG